MTTFSSIIGSLQEEWIPVEDVAELLDVKTRQAHRYGEGANPRIRMKLVAGRKLFHRGDAEAVAAEKQATKVERPKQPRTELVPVSEMLTYIRERDAQVLELQR